MTKSIAEAILEGANQLRKAGVPDARREAGSLAAFALGRNRTFILSHADEPVDEPSLKLLRGYFDERSAGKPLQYITGVQEFFGLEFEVTSDVLIPRPETELLIETAMRLDPNARMICDVGTGSGCIAVTLAHQLPEARVTAVDVSPSALEVAKRNAARHSVGDRITFVVSDCFAELDSQQTVFDMIVSNPPYVADDDLSGLQREVRDFEPRPALQGGPDGLDVIRRLLDESANFLRTGGHLIFEIGFNQHSAVDELIDRRRWKLLDIHSDLQGIPRTVALERLD